MDGQKGGAIDPERLKEMLAETADDVGRRGVYNLATAASTPPPP
jgi:hypothetical protein